MVAEVNSTLAQIKEKVRRLIMEGSTEVFPDSEIERQVNTFIEQIMPFDLRLNNFVERQVFYTTKGVDRYSVDLNAIRQPSGIALASGYEMEWMQDYTAFDREWPKIFIDTTQSGDGGSTYTDTLSTPILRKEVVVSATNNINTQEILVDDGTGTMVEQGTTTNRGSIDYDTGDLSVTFSGTIDSDEDIKIQYVVQNRGRPYTLFFRNDEILLRPVPDEVYKIEYDAFVVPSQLLDDTSTPQVDQWWQYIAFGAAIQILRERQDMESVQVHMIEFERLEEIIINQTAAQNNQMRSSTIYYDDLRSPYRYGNWGGL
jgi:hypothetical protein